MGANTSTTRNNKDVPTKKLDSETKEVLNDFLSSHEPETRCKSFGSYLHRYLAEPSANEPTPKSPAQRLACLSSSDREIQSDAMYVLSSLARDKPTSLKHFVESVCQCALARFWHIQASETCIESWMASWVLVQPKAAILQVYSSGDYQQQQRLKGNSLGLVMLSFDDEDNAAAELHFAKWLANAEQPGRVSMEAWRTWWQHSNVFHELMCLALDYALYPQALSQDLKFILPRISEHNLRSPTANPALESSACLLSPSIGWVISKELPREARLNWTQVYSSKSDGRSWSMFKKAIARRGSLLILVREKLEKGKPRVFGTYIDRDLERHPSWQGTSLNLLFTVQPDDTSVPGLTVYKATGFNDHYQYFNYSTKTLPNGLGIGGQMEHYGLWIDSSFTCGHSNSAATFGSQQLSTHSEFTIDTVEAWLVRPSQRLDSDDEDRAQKSAVEANPEAVAMLEMANRKMYSKELPPPVND
ncbi:hypothetical protein IWW56_004254 [Coemansia sp. RSA 2131]|nr:hypothetical protein IWW56_004254 [Coemansia sp. RSA 2131]